MEAATEHDHVRLAGRVAAQPQGGFDRFRAGIGEEHAVDVARHLFGEAIRQLHDRFVLHDGVLAMHELADLFLRRFDHLRVAVTRAQHANTGCEIQVLATFRVEQVAAFTPRGDDAAGLFQQWRKVRFELAKN